MKAEDQSWFMDFEDVPETPLHAAIIQLLLGVLGHRFFDRDALVTTNLGCQWDPDDARVGIDPDVVLIEPAPPGGSTLSTLRVWEPGHPPPRLAVEVASEHNADKDYIEAPARMARLGAQELWIFDPLLSGPTTTGGPFLLQIWRRSAAAGVVEMERIHAGDAPAYSPTLDAWAVTTEDRQSLRVADDADGTHLWPTQQEAEAAARRAAEGRAEAAERRAEAAEHSVEAAQAELQRLRALLDKKA